MLQAPVHFLVIPKQRDGLTQLSRSEERHEKLLGHLLYVASKVAKQGDLTSQYHFEAWMLGYVRRHA